jgi:hypothetical protein
VQSSEVLSGEKSGERHEEQSEARTKERLRLSTGRKRQDKEQSESGRERQASSAERSVCGAKLEVLSTERAPGAIQGTVHLSTGRKVSAYGAIRRPSRSVKGLVRRRPEWSNPRRSELSRARSGKRKERRNPREAWNAKCRTRSNPGAVRKLSSVDGGWVFGPTHKSAQNVERRARSDPS